MANKSKAKGTRAETKVVNYLRDHGFTEAKRIALHGSKDMGDIEVGTGYHVLEVKAGDQARNVNRKKFEEWMRQTIVEQENQRDFYDTCLRYCSLLIVTPGKQLKDCFVYSFNCYSDHDSFVVTYFDEWVEFMTMYL